MNKFIEMKEMMIQFYNLKIYTCTCMKTLSKEYNNMHDFTMAR